MAKLKFTGVIKAVIFDMDGILINSEPFWRQAEINVFGKHAMILTEQLCATMAGIRLPEVVAHWCRHFDRPDLDQQLLVNEILTEVIRLVKSQGVALPGVIQTMETLLQHNIPMALASSSPMVLIDAVVEKLHIKPYLQLTESAETLEYGKPHPEIFLRTAKKLNIAPHDCLVFEDSIHGIVAARAALMQVVAIPEEHNRARKELGIAHCVLDSMEDFSLSKVCE